MAFLVFVLILVYSARVIYLKYLVILVYVRGVVVFILYISCMCWYVSEKCSKVFLFFGIVIIFMFDLGVWSKFSDVGEHLWMYLYFRFLFNRLITVYTLNLFKISGSLRF